MVAVVMVVDVDPTAEGGAGGGGAIVAYTGFHPRSGRTRYILPAFVQVQSTGPRGFYEWGSIAIRIH